MADAKLPHAFTRKEALAAGRSWRDLEAELEGGTLLALGRGLYLRSDAGADPNLVEIAMRAGDGALCLVSALAHHDLTDEIPRTLHVALPRGRRHPRAAAPVTWHTFAQESFEVGRSELEVLGELTLGVYDPMRSIVDAFRLAHVHGRELGLEALRRWIRRRGSSPARLLAVAEHFPTTRTSLRAALEVLQ